MTASKQKGTRAETAVVDFLRANGFRGVERRATSGAKDKGDIAGLADFVIEVKDCSRQELAKWLDESIVERSNADAAVGMVWHKRRGKGSPGDWFVTMSGWDILQLLQWVLVP